MIQLLKLQSYS